MKLTVFFITAKLVSFTAAASIQGVRELPARVVHSSVKPTTVDDKDMPESPLEPPLELPELKTKMRLPVAWIKEFLTFKSHDISISLLGDNQPLKSKFTNFERTMSDETDLRSWTRYIIDHDREELRQTEAQQSQDSVDLRIDEFISYLVQQRSFKKEDLQFLHRQDLDYGYEQIEEELTKVYEREKQAKQIKVWGEVLEASRSLPVRTSFILLTIAAATGACLLAC